MKNKRPLILITNDDSVGAKGISVLIETMKNLGDVVVVAPEDPMSGQAHAITVTQPLRVRKVSEEDGVSVFAVNGTPVDCVKLGIRVVLDREPDLLVSGINHGSNASINVIYSGTMAAVLEGCISGIPSIGFSLLNVDAQADFTACVPFVHSIAQKTLQDSLPNGVCLNVNIPDLHTSEIKGVKFCRQSKSKWIELFDERVDPHGKRYYWLTGSFEQDDLCEDTDQYALNEGYVSVVPVQYDFTAHDKLAMLNEWEKEL
ncbi:MAG: 5'/3'-nucleotidase SurE [Bacteroidales bacterium]